jgi:putative Mg2+ transporter-C (MgtC) family protein
LPRGVVRSRRVGRAGCRARSGRRLLSGDGVEAAGAVVVVVANLVLRPVARRIERLPVDVSTEVETAYRLDFACRDEQEAHVRALLLQSLSGGGFTLRSLRSEDIEPGGRVNVSAELIAAGRVDS